MHDQDHDLVDLALAVAREQLTTTKLLQSPGAAELAAAYANLPLIKRCPSLR